MTNCPPPPTFLLQVILQFPMSFGGENKLWPQSDPSEQVYRSIPFPCAHGRGGWMTAPARRTDLMASFRSWGQLMQGFGVGVGR